MPPRFADHPEHAAAVISAVLEAVSPRKAVARALSRKPVPPHWPVIAIGKAARTMVRGLLDACPDHFAEGVIIAPAAAAAQPASDVFPPRFRVIEGEHPLPGEGSIAAGIAVAEFAETLARRLDVQGVLVLVSGGASSLVCRPSPPWTLADIRSVSRALLSAGADIQSLNAVRREMDTIKGGGLRTALGALAARVLAVSDVIGDSWHDIASGPMTPNPTTAADALGVLQFHGLTGAFPILAEALRFGAAAREPGGTINHPQELGSSRADTELEIVARNADARSAAALALMGLGFPAPTQRVMLGSADSLGRHLAMQAAMLFNQPVPAAAIVGGETTVAVPPGAGFGGRNQHAALVAAISLEASRRAAVFTFSTDGVDGATPPNNPPSAGAIVTNSTVARARSMGIEPLHFLRRCDSYTFFAHLDERLCAAGTLRAGEQPSHLLTGPTGTNVNDLAVVMCYGS